jgi:hypothetical protein
VPYLGGSVAGMLAGWMVDGMLEPFLGQGPTLFVSFVVSTVVFYAAYKFLKDLRDT